MKKLVLKKDIVARINGGEMNQLRRGCGPDGFCNQYTIAHSDATCGHPCNGDPSCPGQQTCVESCMDICNFLRNTAAIYNAGNTCIGMCVTGATCWTY